jgi:NAD-dependent deacetylase
MRKNIVVISGAGISAESGISTYRDTNGLWQVHNHSEVASPEAWKADRLRVIEFWNSRRKSIELAQPNAAHYSLVKLEQYANVKIITQNVDDFHERAGSSNVLHLHGDITKARSSVDKKLIYELNGRDIKIGDRCSKNSQLRPHVVWFGEQVPLFKEAQRVAALADILLVIGCSLKVYPAAYLVEKRPQSVPMFVINPDIEQENEFYSRQPATVGCEIIVNRLIEKHI